MAKLKPSDTFDHFAVGEDESHQKILKIQKLVSNRQTDGRTKRGKMDGWMEHGSQRRERARDNVKLAQSVEKMMISGSDGRDFPRSNETFPLHDTVKAVRQSASWWCGRRRRSNLRDRPAWAPPPPLPRPPELSQAARPSRFPFCLRSVFSIAPFSESEEPIEHWPN